VVESVLGRDALGRILHKHLFDEVDASFAYDGERVSHEVGLLVLNHFEGQPLFLGREW